MTYTEVVYIVVVEIMEVSVYTHCGNSPKVEALIELMTALCHADAQKIEQGVDRNVQWNLLGNLTQTYYYKDITTGKKLLPGIGVLNIDNALSHGRGAMCEGRIEYTYGETEAFVSVATFTNVTRTAVVKYLRTYCVPINNM